MTKSRVKDESDIEGSIAFDRFQDALKKIISVPKDSTAGKSFTKKKKTASR
jgi:hypothetical protein